MERFWNIVHYFAYRANYKLHLMFNKINPVLYVYKLPFAKRHFEKKGYDPVDVVNEAYRRPDIGISQIFSGGLMYALPGIFFVGLHCLYIAFVEKPKSWEQFLYVFIGYWVISFLINHIFLFRHDKYISYFKEFEKMPRKWKIKWAWISFGVILFPFLTIAAGFIALLPK
jgi:hypothetical protein